MNQNQAQKLASSGASIRQRVNVPTVKAIFYPGGEKFTTAAEMMEKDPTSLITIAVRGMLPKNKLGRKIATNLRVYAGPVHPHTAQEPEIFEL